MVDHVDSAFNTVTHLPPESEAHAAAASRPQEVGSAEPTPPVQHQSILGDFANGLLSTLFGRDAAAQAATSVNQQEVNAAVANAGVAEPNGSALARELRNPKLNQAERNLLIQTLAREARADPFYAGDISRQHDRTGLTADQRTIADAVDHAYRAGAINAKDIVHISDAARNGLRFMSVLGQGSNARQSGGAAEALADALWARNGYDNRDRMAAAMYYTSDPTLMANNLNSPENRAAAFNVLVRVNDDPNSLPPLASVAEDGKSSALAGAGRLFAANSQELIDANTNSENGVQSEALAKFLSQTVFNPSAKGIALDRERDLVPTVREALGNAADRYVDLAQHARTPKERRAAARQFGVMTADVSAGAQLALQKYSATLGANAAARAQFGNAVADVTNKMVEGTRLGKAVDTPFGNPIVEGARKAAEAAAGKAQQRPGRPDADLARRLHDAYQGRMHRQAEPHESDWSAAYGDEAQELEGSLELRKH